MIFITNEQDAISVDIEQLKHDAQHILDELAYHDFDLSIVLVSDDRMHAMNKQFREKDKATDILSFPFYPNLKAGERIHADSDDDKNLGDIIIAPHYVQDTLEQWNQSFEMRMRILLVHGICHLLGYDHIQDDDYEVMKKEEERLLKTLNS